jgi:radical SAM protein with 4Fe4S-binding SPASM domain
VTLRKRLYYDEQLFIQKHKDYVWFMSPANNSFFRIKEYYYPIFHQILENKGEINYSNIKESFERDSNDPLSVENLENVIEGTLKSRVFFGSARDFQQAAQDYKSDVKERVPFKMVYMHLTLRCNYDCWYCYNGRVSKNKADELNTEQWLDIVDKFSEHNTKLFVFTGGEPLLRQDLPEILERAKASGAKVNLLSNGSLFTEDKIKTLLPLVDKVIVSLDSFDKQSQGKNRSQAGFENIIRLLNYFKEHPAEREKITVRSVVTTVNYKEIVQFRKTLRERYQIKNHIYLKFIPNTPDEFDLVPRDNLIKDLMSIEALEELMEPTTASGTPDFRKRCDACFASVAINPRGDMYPCHQFLDMPEYRMLNMLDEQWFQDYLDSTVKQEFSTLDVDKLDECSGCQFRYLCGGGCPALGLKLYGSIHKMVEYQCEENKEMARARLLSSRLVKAN